MNISSVVWERWIKHPTDETKIIGEWAEDCSSYEITVPPQLRDTILLMQNTLSDRYVDVGIAKQHLYEAETRLNPFKA